MADSGTKNYRHFRYKLPKAVELGTTNQFSRRKQVTFPGLQGEYLNSCLQWASHLSSGHLISNQSQNTCLVLQIAAFSAFLKHAFREVTSGFCKGTVPGAPPRPSPGPLRMPKNNSKETYSVPPKGHLLAKNMWSDSQVVQRYRTRGAPFPVHKAPRMPKDSS